jgi:high-affinity iron transporter
VIANFLTGLREGLEASLVISILVAYLVKSGRRDRLPDIWIGVGAALALSLSFGAVLQFTSQSMSFEAQETFGGVMSIFAVGLVTWMIFWMRRTARFIKADLEGRVAGALAMSRFAVVVIAFVSVGREGIETSLFLWASTQTAGGGVSPVVGIVLGLGSAVVLGYLMYRSAVRVNLAKFFTYTSYALVVVAAGVLAYGVHDLQEAGRIGGGEDVLFDISSAVPLTSWYGSLLKGAFNFTPAPTVVEFAVWLGYLVTVFALLLWPRKSPSSAPTPAAGMGRRIAFGTLVGAATAVAVGVVVSGTSAQGEPAAADSASVVSGDRSCDVPRRHYEAGKVAFRVTNAGDDITEVYLYGEKGGSFSQIVNEVENIGPGAVATMTVDLKPGQYQVMCKPGMVDDHAVGVVITVG